MRIIELTQISGAEDMFDEYIDTQTETAEEISKTFDITGMNAVMILNNYGVSASLTVDGETQTVSLIRDSIKDWWDYWFAPSRIGKDIVFYFPQQTSGSATIVISYPGGTAKCGLCIKGLAKELGKTRTDLKTGISDYSIIDTDGFGQTYLSVGRWAKRSQASLNITDNIDLHYRDVVNNRGKATGYDYNNYAQTLNERHTSEDGISLLVQYGFIENFDIVPKTQAFSVAKIETQGLI